MKKVIVTTGTARLDFAVACWESQRAYAERVGADFRLLMENPTSNPYKSRFHLIETACHGLRGGDVMLWLDWDILVSDTADDVFKLCPKDGVMMPVWNTWRDVDMRSVQRKASSNFTLENYHNIGVMLYKVRENAPLLEAMSHPAVTACFAGKQLLEASAPFELGVNVALSTLGTTVTALPSRFHAVAPATADFTHFIGPDKYDHKLNFFPRHHENHR